MAARDFIGRGVNDLSDCVDERRVESVPAEPALKRLGQFAEQAYDR